MRTICVYCASSAGVDGQYADSARRLGVLLAERSVAIVYGGGAAGPMGALADGALAAGGRVIGVLPRFMDERGWGRQGLTELRVVADIHERKRAMISQADAVVALPGGAGTFEELLEAIAWRQLGLYRRPIVIVNIKGFFDPLVALLDSAIRQRFMEEHHRRLWTVVQRVEDVLPAVEQEDS